MKGKLLYGLIGLSALLMIIFSIIAPNVSDSYDHLMAAQTIKECNCIPTYDLHTVRLIYRPPFDAFLYSLFLPFPKIVNVLFGFFSIFMTYLILRHYVDKKHALLGSAFYAMVPIIVYLSSIMYSYIVLLGFLQLAFYFLVVKDKWLPASIFMVIALWSNLSALFFLPLAFVYYLSKKQYRKLFLYYGVVLVFGTWWFIHLYMVTGNPVYPKLPGLFGNPTLYTPSVISSFGLRIVIAITGFVASLFGTPEGEINILYNLAEGFGLPSLLVHLGLVFLTGIVVLLVIATFHAIKKKDWLPIATLAALYLLFYVIRFLGVPSKPAADGKFALILVPFLSLGAIHLYRSSKKLFALVFILFIAATSLGLGARFYLAAQERQNIEPFLDYIRDETPTNSVIYLDNLTARISQFGVEYDTGRTAILYEPDPLNPQNNRNIPPAMPGSYYNITLRGPGYVITRTSCEPVLVEGHGLTLCPVSFR